MHAELEAILKNWKPVPITTPRGTPSVFEEEHLRRLLGKVAIDVNGCWLYTGCLTRKGYGHFSFERRNGRAHRYAYLALVGPIPDGLELDHLCRVRHCINPAHLEAVTHLENLGRRVMPELVTHCINGHEYTPENTYSKPNGKRICRVCKNAEKARYRARKAAARKGDAR